MSLGHYDSRHTKRSVCVLRFRRRQIMPSLWGRGGGIILLASWGGVRRTCLSAGRQDTKVVRHQRDMVVDSVCHYDGALIGAQKDCLRWDVEGQRGALQPNRAVTQPNCVAALLCPHPGAVLSWFQPSGRYAALKGQGAGPGWLCRGPSRPGFRPTVAKSGYRFITLS